MNIVVMAGDDIGPEIIAAAMAVVKAADAEFSLGLRFTDVEVGMASHRKHGTTLTDAALQATIDADGVIVGPCGMTDYPPLAEGGLNRQANMIAFGQAALTLLIDCLENSK